MEPWRHYSKGGRVIARSSNQDPLDRFRFVVQIDDFTRSGFTTCSAPAYSIEKKEYKEGGRHLNPLVIVDGVSYKPVTLTRGVNTDTSFNKWATGFIDVVQNNTSIQKTGGFSDFLNNPAKAFDNALGGALDGGVKSVPSNTGNYTEYSYRRLVKIFQVDRAGQYVVAYFLYNAFPIEYVAASEFDASSSEVSIETLVLGYEGFEVKYAGIAGTLGSLGAQSLLKR